MKDWKVYFHGGLWGHHERDHAGKEIKVEKWFVWGDEDWYIPSIYVCAAGLVVDYCVAVTPQRIKDFIAKWQLTADDNTDFSDECRERMEIDNPMNVDFSSQIEINGKILKQTHGTGTSWVHVSVTPENCARRDNDIAEQMMMHYGLDLEMAWVMQRVSYPWVTKRKPKIKTLKLTLFQNPVNISGIHLKNPQIGDSFSFVHPISGETHRLFVMDWNEETLAQKHFNDDAIEWPTHYKMMNFTVVPELANHRFSLRDCAQSDPPRRKNVDKRGCRACAVSVIGGADGPTAIFIAGRAPAQMHTAITAVHFKPVEDVEWRMVFHEKMKDDLSMELSLGQ